MDIVLFGIQGSGKGTQGKIIADKYHMRVFETGAELRRLAKEDSTLGKKVKNLIEAGQLVPNEIVMEIIENFSKNFNKSEKVLFDGIPRKMEQAQSFDKLMKELNREFICVLIDISEKEAYARLTTRRICKECKSVYPSTYEKEKCEKCQGKLITRQDDNPESIKVRLDSYYKETMPVIEYYEKAGKLYKINGEQKIDRVSNDIIELLNKILTQES